jgi:hypothetical protein
VEFTTIKLARGFNSPAVLSNLAVPLTSLADKTMSSNQNLFQSSFSMSAAI